MISLGLGDTSCHHTHTHFRDELHRDLPFRVSVLEVMDQLSKILNGVDVVVGRRGDEAHALFLIVCVCVCVCVRERGRD
jgi:hypothetical protein